MSAEKLRQQGNELYKKGSITEALILYRRAAAADRKSVAPLTNITAALYETGQYIQCVNAIHDAISLATTQGVLDDALHRKLRTRELRAQILLKNYDAAKFLVADHYSLLSAQELRLDAIEQGESLQAAARRSEETSKRLVLDRVVSDIPRYKAKILEATTFFAHGHDTQLPLYHDAPPTAVMLAGIGDARHLHTAITDISVYELTSKNATKKNYHITTVDVNCATLARNLVTFVLLDDLVNACEKRNMKTMNLLVGTLYYVFEMGIMPPMAYTRMQQAITTALKICQGTAQLDWVFVRPQDRPFLARQLVIMQTQLPELLPTQAVRLAKHLRPSNPMGAAKPATLLEALDKQIPEKKCELDQVLFNGARVVMPPPALMEDDDPLGLHGIRAVRQAKKLVEKPDWLAKVDKHWKPNVTVVDLDWEEARMQGDPSTTYLDSIENPVRDFTQLLRTCTEKPTVLYEGACTYFEILSGALLPLRSRLVVEVILGDMGEIFEKIRFDLLDYRKKPIHGSKKAPRKIVFPRVYDIIHMSNIPDYIGGSLASYLYCMPIINKSNPDSYFTSLCLRNPTSFGNQECFDTEYCLTTGNGMLRKLFLSELMNYQAGESFVSQPYLEWHCEKDALSFDRLLDRKTLQTWLSAMFMKLAVPPHGSTSSHSHIYSPLNLSNFFRLIRHLHVVGYPAHWLAEVLASLLTNSVFTGATPPRTSPMKSYEVSQMMTRPARKFDVRPFVAELASLATMWLPTLGFSLLQNASLPSLATIHTYSLKFDPDQIDVVEGNEPYQILVFAKPGQKEDSIRWRSHLHAFLRGHPADLAKYNSEDIERFRSGVHIVSTWTFHTKTHTGSFSIDKAVMEKMRKEKWVCAVFRSDYWRTGHMPDLVMNDNAAVKDLGPWIESKAVNSKPETRTYPTLEKMKEQVIQHRSRFPSSASY